MGAKGIGIDAFCFHVESKTKLHVTSDAEAPAERAAFLATAKCNSSIILAKYL